MKLLTCVGCLFPTREGNVNNKLRPEKVLSSCLRTRVQIPSAPPCKKHHLVGGAFCVVEGIWIFNAARMSAAGEGIAEPHLNFIDSPRLHQKKTDHFDTKSIWMVGHYIYIFTNLWYDQLNKLEFVELFLWGLQLQCNPNATIWTPEYMDYKTTMKYLQTYI